MALTAPQLAALKAYIASAQAVTITQWNRTQGGA